jgi:hypothetical protein
MSTFIAIDTKPLKKSKGDNTRLQKSKEQKQVEKDAIEAI